MNSREKILAAVKKNQPPLEELPSLAAINAISFEQVQETFQSVLQGIGGLLLVIDDLQQVTEYVTRSFPEGSKYITSISGLPGLEQLNSDDDAHKLEDVEAAVISGAFGVAENGAIWVTGSSFKVRVLPFICQHLVLVLPAQNIVHNMHEAYERIAADTYDYGVFIAGPSKTADIEQSLVLGAHGSRSLTVFLVAEK